MAAKTWIRYLERPELREPVAVVGSPGLRSVGKLAIDHLISELKPTLIAELYSSHLPLFHQTSPSYAPSPEFPGEPGVTVAHNSTDLPKVEFYHSSNPDQIIARGYHANFHGQYEVAEKVLDLFKESRVERMFVIAGYAQEGEAVCCAATSPNMIEEMKRHSVEKGYEGPFYGFSGLVFGLAALRDIKGVCLFGRTKPNLEYPEYPDPYAAKAVLEKLRQILSLDLKLPDLPEETRS